MKRAPEVIEYLFAAKSDTGKRTGPQVPNNHEEPCPKICHSGEKKIETKKPNRANTKM